MIEIIEARGNTLSFACTEGEGDDNPHLWEEAPETVPMHHHIFDRAYDPEHKYRQRQLISVHDVPIYIIWNGG